MERQLATTQQSSTHASEQRQAVWPLVSVVTPSFNQAPFLEATIGSVLSQDYPNLEYLIMDGGSTDGSAEIIRRYEDRLASWVSERDRGQSDAINKGWRRARGEIIAYLNSDDLYLPGAVRRAVEYLQAHPEVAVVYSDCLPVDRAGQASGPALRMPPFSFEWLLTHPLPQPTMFVRREVIERIGLMDEALYYTMDWDWCLRAVVAGFRFHKLDGEPLAAFRWWDGQKTHGGFERQIDEHWLIRDRLLASDGMTAPMAKQTRLSKGWCCLYPAYLYHQQGHRAKALRVLGRAVSAYPPILWHRDFLKLLPRVLVGRGAIDGVRRLLRPATG